MASLTAVAFIYACANDDAAPAPDAARPSSEPDAALPDEEDAAAAPSCPEPIPAGELQGQASGPSVFGRVVSRDLGSFDPMAADACGLQGVRICMFEAETCTESDEAGQFVLADLPSETDVEITFEKAGFFPVLRLAHVQGAPINLTTVRILTEGDRRTLLESVDVGIDPEQGGMVAIALEPGEAIGTVAIPHGVEITLLPGDIAPYYSRGALLGELPSDELDPEIESTRAGGWAMFPGLDPGDYTVRFERDGVVCGVSLPGFGFGVDSEGHVRVRIRKGFNTASIAALCQ
jgi:hypothetical protein